MISWDSLCRVMESESFRPSETISCPSRFASKTFLPGRFRPSRFAPDWMFRPQDVSAPSRFAPTFFRIVYLIEYIAF